MELCTSAALQADANEFVPEFLAQLYPYAEPCVCEANSVSHKLNESCCDVDVESLVFEVNEKDLRAQPFSLSACSRRILREPGVAEVLPSPTPVPAEVFVKLSRDSELQVLVRIVLRDAGQSEVLPEIPSICVGQVKITTTSVRSCRSESAVAQPMRVYKHPQGNKSLRGLDMKDIGEEHPMCDKAMFIDGPVQFLSESSERPKVSGYARLDGVGASYRVFGWIDKWDVKPDREIENPAENEEVPEWAEMLLRKMEKINNAFEETGDG
jgi:hypothetical protein